MRTVCTTALVLVLICLGCVPKNDLAGAACPCIEGWDCCNGVCIEETAVCDDTSTESETETETVSDVTPVTGYEWHTFYGDWAKGFNGTYGYEMALDDKQNIYLVGSADLPWDGPGNEPPLNAYSGGGCDLFVLKLSADGDYVWHTFFGAKDGVCNGDSGYDVDLRGGALFISGRSFNPWDGPGATAPVNQHSENGSNLFALKLDVDGAYQWHTFHGATDDIGNSIATGEKGDVFVVGTSAETWDGPGGEPPLCAHSGGDDILILKLDGSGEYVWHAFYGGDADAGIDAAVDPSGNVVVLGNSDVTFFGPEGQAPITAHSTEDVPVTDAVLIQLSQNGHYTWHAFYGPRDADEGHSLTIDGEGNIYVTGSSQDSWDGPGGESPLSEHTSEKDITVLKLTKYGIYEWHTFLGSYEIDQGFAITHGGAGGLFITGASFGNWDGPQGEPPITPHNGSDGEDLFVLKLTQGGTYRWHAFFGSERHDQPRAVVTDGGVNLWIAGAAYGTWDGPEGEAPLNPHTAGEGHDAFVLKLKDPEML